MPVAGQELERFDPALPWPELAYEHLARYLFAAAFVGGRRVLDAGCGQGYGSAILSNAGARVVALDRELALFTAIRSGHPVAADLERLPFREHSFDRIVAFEVLEHLARPERLLDQLQRCLAADGILLLSTPDRVAYSDATGYRNPYHVHEYSEPELRSSLGRRFAALRIWRQGVAAGCAFWPAGDPSGGWRVESGDLTCGPGRLEGAATAPYLMCACAAREDVLVRAGLPAGLVVLDRAGWLLRRHEQVRLELVAQEAALKAELARAAEQLAKVEQDNRAKQAEIDQASRHIAHVERVLAEVQGHLDNHARRLAELEGDKK
jgi:SAM-dependent methyltransferase